MEKLKKSIHEKNYIAGIRQVGRFLSEDKIDSIYLAADAEDAFKMSVLQSANVAGIDVKICSSMNEFSLLTGIEVNCAVIGTLKK